MRRPRVRLVTLRSGGVGAPPGWPLRAACQELADDPGTVRTKARPDAEKERRSEAPEGAPVRVMDRWIPQGIGLTARRATGCGVPHRRLSALRSPRFSRGHRKGGFARRPPKNKAAGRRSIGWMNAIIGWMNAILCRNTLSRHPEVRATSAFTRVFDALWRASKDGRKRRCLLPSFEARRCRGEHLRMTPSIVAHVAASTSG